ncbi:MAG: nickel-responsive transcriptional regulator NikR [Synergistaceae bacterium]|nr:nickel-responsive transcriptional regulator NikR [Synergistaceae bacterium]
MDSLVRFGVAVPASLLAEFDQYIQGKGLQNRSEALRQLIREKLAREIWSRGEGTVFGTVTIMYDHHVRDATNSLTTLQHDFGEAIICTTHVHVDHSHCLECIVLKGDAKTIREFEDALSLVRGIKTVDLSISAIL